MQSKTLQELADYIGAQVHGDPQRKITGIATLKAASATELSFLGNPAYRKFLPDTQAAAVILSPKQLDECPTNALVVENPYFAYAKLAELFSEKPKAKIGIHPSAIISEHAQIDDTVSIAAGVIVGDGVVIAAHTVIGAGCVIGERAQIGESCQLEANVTVCYQSIIGKRVIIHSGAVIGSDGFGLAEREGVWHKITQLGRVVIEDDVEIGANTTIDRGALGDTVLEKGVKLDNQIQIGHNVRIGEHTAIAACAGIAGSTRIGKHCQIGGGAGVNGHLEIADYTVITGMAMVTNSVKTPGVYSSGTGFLPNHEWKKNVARFRQLDKLLRRLMTAVGKKEEHVERLPAEAFEGQRAPIMKEKYMSITEVFNHLPQRPPFLLIDRIVKFEPGKSLTAIKNITINEDYFQGHFPGHPIMPGVLILEALAQACTVFAFLTTGEDPKNGSIYYFAGIDKARFKRPVEPGDQLVLDVEFLKARQGVWKMKGTASVADEIVCTAELLSAKASGREKS